MFVSGMLLMQTSKINNARDAVKQDGLKNTDDTLQYIEGMSEQELGVTRGIVDYIKAHSKSLETFQDDHWSQASSINQRAEETFQQRYMPPDKRLEEMLEDHHTVDPPLTTHLSHTVWQ
ncbi:hypothetical protein V6N12_030959 [Hibiscus sabdariffa]|uniref:Uncharacterized protein n=1 Tax=Hibiscus sabdariffa TaxID=183260 RepID=A0ABR2EB28_9ROSI